MTALPAAGTVPSGPLLAIAQRPWARVLLLALVVAGPLAGLVGAELGADQALRSAAAEAGHLRGEGHLAEAIAVDRALAERTGPLHLLSRESVDEASAEIQGTMIEWARSLAGHGRVDQAVAALAGVTEPELLEAARQARAEILLDAARAAAGNDDHLGALARLDQLREEPAPQNLTRQADELRPGYDLGAAPRLARSGRAADAVALLDDARARPPSGGIQPAVRAMLPATLLAAAHQSLDAENQREAQGFLLRLQNDFGSTREGRSARLLLQSPQPVSGTLVHRGGQPLAAAVRLSGRFRQVAGGYLTSGPFYLATADSNGDFSFKDVPPGGPYILEIFSGGEWTTSIDPATGRPANSFTVEQLVPGDLGFVLVP